MAMLLRVSFQWHRSEHAVSGPVEATVKTDMYTCIVDTLYKYYGFSLIENTASQLVNLDVQYCIVSLIRCNIQFKLQQMFLLCTYKKSH